MDSKIKENISEVCVWDWQTRALHWINALLVISLMILAIGFEWMEELGATKAMRKPVKEIHAYIGYVFVVTFLLRIIWGFIGNSYARWSDTLPLSGKKWKEAFSNLRWVLGGLKGTPPVEVGHNPLASIAYAALFIVLVSQATTGLALSGKEFGMFPGTMIVAKENKVAEAAPVVVPENGKEENKEDGREGIASGVKKEGEKEEDVMMEVAEELHEFGLWFMLFFIAAHLAGLVLHEIGERRGLFSSMINGRKYYGKDEL
ncbi:MAG: cytochrome b/b6 domain-containing protein [Deltaproteobacteria bacterium]